VQAAEERFIGDSSQCKKVLPSLGVCDEPLQRLKNLDRACANSGQQQQRVRSDLPLRIPGSHELECRCADNVVTYGDIQRENLAAPFGPHEVHHEDIEAAHHMKENACVLVRKALHHGYLPTHALDLTTSLHPCQPKRGRSGWYGKKTL
jgi:hypothetical protein